MASCARVRRRRTACALVAATLTGLVTTVTLGASTARADGVAAATSAPTVRLAHVTPVLERAGQPLTVTLTRTGPAGASDATVQLTLYARLTTRSGLLAAISGPGPSGPVATTGALPASCLASGGAVTVSVPVAPDGTAVAHRTLCGRGAPVLRLGCTVDCDGVYPLRVAVHGAGGVATIDTVVTYASTRATAPLRFAWVVRVAGPSSALAGAKDALAGLAANPAVPVTLDVQGQAVAAPPAAGLAVLPLLRAAAKGPHHELLVEPYVAAALGTLRASDLPEEVARQFARTAATLRLDGVATPPARTVTFGSGPQTPTSVDAVASQGYAHLVVLGTSLAVDPASTLRWGEVFRLGGAPSGPTALASDTDLSMLSDATAADPGLTAANLLGELAFLHFEEPYLPEPRAALAVTEATPEVATPFVDQVLAGLHGNPVVTPVTVSGAFRAVPVGANGFPGVRDLALPASGPYATGTVSFIRSLRIRIDALASAVRGGLSPIPSLEGQLLSAEQPMPAGMRERILLSVHGHLEAEQGYFHIYDGAITLTQAGANLPITVFSSAPYTYTGFLVLSSPKLTFPQGHVIQLHGPVGGVYSVRVPATAEVTGDIPLTAQLLTPDRRFQLTRSTITVRATQTSIVGIALTVLAVVVLAAWWIRTSRKRRAAR